MQVHYKRAQDMVSNLIFVEANSIDQKHPGGLIRIQKKSRCSDSRGYDDGIFQRAEEERVQEFLTSSESR